MHEMCRPRFDYNGVEHGSMKKKAKATTSNTFTKALEVVAKKFQEELVAFRASADAWTEAMVSVLEHLASGSQGVSSSQMTSKAKVVVVDETSSDESPPPK